MSDKPTFTDTPDLPNATVQKELDANQNIIQNIINVQNVNTAPQGQPLGNQPQNTQEQVNTNLETHIQDLKRGWMNKIADLEENMKTLPKVNELLSDIYLERQKCVDEFFSMNSVIMRQTKDYRAQFTNIFNNIKINGYNGMRLNSDQSITKEVEYILQDKKYMIDLLESHKLFISETLKTIDNMIYGINQKVKVFEMLNGLKF